MKQVVKDIYNSDLGYVNINNVLDVENRILSIEKQNKWIKIGIICCLVFSLSVFICFLIFKIDVPDAINTSLSVLIIAFIGALATIVVIRNDSQVKEIKDDSSKKIEDIKRELHLTISEKSKIDAELILKIENKLKEKELIFNKELNELKNKNNSSSKSSIENSIWTGTDRKEDGIHICIIEFNDLNFYYTEINNKNGEKTPIDGKYSYSSKRNHVDLIVDEDLGVYEAFIYGNIMILNDGNSELKILYKEL